VTCSARVIEPDPDGGRGDSLVEPVKCCELPFGLQTLTPGFDFAPFPENEACCRSEARKGRHAVLAGDLSGSRAVANAVLGTDQRHRVPFDGDNIVTFWAVLQLLAPAGQICEFTSLRVHRTDYCASIDVRWLETVSLVHAHLRGADLQHVGVLPSDTTFGVNTPN
jgi:hypothetical protein